MQNPPPEFKSQRDQLNYANPRHSYTLDQDDRYMDEQLDIALDLYQKAVQELETAETELLDLLKSIKVK